LVLGLRAGVVAAGVLLPGANAFAQPTTFPPAPPVPGTQVTASDSPLPEESSLHTPDPSQPTSDEPTLPRSEFERHVADGVAAFAAREFAAALRSFDQAAALTTDAESLGTLHFNAGVCEFELGRFVASERRFAAAAATGYTDGDGARLHAGFAALRAGQLSRAAEHARLVVPRGERESVQKRDLLEEIRAARLSVQQRVARAHVKDGFVALGAGRVDESREEFRRALASSRYLSPSDLVDTHYGLARIDAAREQHALALNHLRIAIELQPGDQELHWLRGMSYERLGRKTEAVRSYRRALACETTSAQATRAQDAIDDLHPLGAAGVSGNVQVSGGVDSNASQSGSASTRGFTFPTAAATAEEATSSPFVALSAQVQYDRRVSQDWALLPTYTASVLLLTESSVRPLSLTLQEFAIGLSHAPNMATRWDLRAGAALLLSGAPPDDPFTSETFVLTGAAFETSPHWQTFVNAELARVWGLNESSALTGYRTGVELGERLSSRALSASASVRVTITRAGTETFALQRIVAPVCRFMDRAQFVCEDAAVAVPLSHVDPELRFGVRWWPSDVWSVGFSGGVLYRHDLESSALLIGLQRTLVDETLKRRRDVRFDAALDMRLHFWRDSSLFTFLRQSGRVNRSNLAPDAADPNHRFDYEDRNYTQSLTEVGLGFGW
jgi:tetratricopeptide (TPR) repeat protein